MWDQRYAAPGFAYGTEANDHLSESIQYIRGSSVLCIAEGEGRNATALALAGFDVLGVDQSSVGLEKARGLAASRGVSIRTEVADLASFEIAPGRWDGIVAIFCHLPPPLRKQVHAACVAGLQPGGVFILEAYTPAQLEYKTGGPQVAELLMTLDALKQELAGLEWIVAREVTRHIHEGQYHEGMSATVQLVGRKPL